MRTPLCPLTLLLPNPLIPSLYGFLLGCFANIGQSKAKRVTLINLNVDGCFHLPGNSIHELLHILGVTHEHMRPDRDNFVDIAWGHIRPGT